uniref:Uncharacterized protein n=1 Tax=Ascaris lumbricoides TaxID=6252 RepID=A0A0M3HME5_ASCLU
MSGNEGLSFIQNASSLQWSQFRYAIESERWVSDDHSVLTQLPKLPSTRLEMAIDKGSSKYSFSELITKNSNELFCKKTNSST